MRDLATVEQLTHGWDLARATGQPADLDPVLAAGLLATCNDRGGTAAVPAQARPRTQPCQMTETSLSVDYRGMVKMCCNVITDLPVGAGVSSSASLTLAVVAALAALQHGGAPGTADACAAARQAETGELGTGAGCR